MNYTGDNSHAESLVGGYIFRYYFGDYSAVSDGKSTVSVLCNNRFPYNDTLVKLEPRFRAKSMDGSTLPTT